MSDIFFTSDTHFGHRGIIRYSARSRGHFRDVDEMDEALIRNWNSRVRDGDCVYHLGDLSFRPAKATALIVARLNGVKHLVLGNHDDPNGEVKGLFASVRNAYHETVVDGRRLVLCHYPLMTWNRGHHGAWHLHGHCHGTLKAPKTTRLDVGVDTNALYPWSWEEVVAEFSTRAYLVSDHHERRRDED